MARPATTPTTDADGGRLPPPLRLLLVVTSFVGLAPTAAAVRLAWTAAAARPICPPWSVGAFAGTVLPAADAATPAPPSSPPPPHPPPARPPPPPCPSATIAVTVAATLLAATVASATYHAVEVYTRRASHPWAGTLPRGPPADIALFVDRLAAVAAVVAVAAALAASGCLCAAVADVAGLAVSAAVLSGLSEVAAAGRSRAAYATLHAGWHVGVFGVAWRAVRTLGRGDVLRVVSLGGEE